MHVVVLGAGRIGQYVAQSLSLDGASVVLVDVKKERLEEASQKMDVAIRRGLGTDWKLLAELMEENPELVLALTEDDEVNFVSCAIAKSLGNVRTIARVRDSRYLTGERFDVRRLFHVDHLVVPELLVTDQIGKIALNRGMYSESFFHGGVLLRTIRIPDNWKESGKMLAELRTSERRMIAAVCKRQVDGQDQIFFPHGQDCLLAGDEVTLIGDSSLVHEIETLFGLDLNMPKSALIVGGQLVGNELARELDSKGLRVSLVEPSAERCYRLAEELPNVTVLNSQNVDWDFLKAEQVENADVFVACTISDEKNLQLCLFAKELGCQKVIVVLSDQATARLAEKYGISHVVSPRVATTDKILSLVRAQKVNAVVSLYDGRAEITEVRVSLDSPIAGIPLSILGPKLPLEMLIAVIHNRGRLFIAGGSHILSPHDEVIVVCDPQHRNYLEQIF